MAGVKSLTCVGWQVTLCDPVWQVTLRSSEMGYRQKLKRMFNRFSFNVTVLLTILTTATRIILIIIEGTWSYSQLFTYCNTALYLYAQNIFDILFIIYQLLRTKRSAEDNNWVKTVYLLYAIACRNVHNKNRKKKQKSWKTFFYFEFRGWVLEPELENFRKSS